MSDADRLINRQPPSNKELAFAQPRPYLKSGVWGAPFDAAQLWRRSSTAENFTGHLDCFRQFSFSHRSSALWLMALYFALWLVPFRLCLSAYASAGLHCGLKFKQPRKAGTKSPIFPQLDNTMGSKPVPFHPQTHDCPNGKASRTYHFYGHAAYAGTSKAPTPDR